MESSAHPAFKARVIGAQEGDTALGLKQLTPVRLLHNPFAAAVRAAEARGASPEELAALLGRGRAKRGMFEGDLEEGELEIGQVSALLDGLPTAGEVVRTLVSDYRRLTAGMQDPHFTW